MGDEGEDLFISFILSFVLHSLVSFLFCFLSFFLSFVLSWCLFILFFLLFLSFVLGSVGLKTRTLLDALPIGTACFCAFFTTYIGVSRGLGWGGVGLISQRPKKTDRSSARGKDHLDKDNAWLP